MHLLPWMPDQQTGYFDRLRSTRTGRQIQEGRRVGTGDHRENGVRREELNAAGPGTTRRNAELTRYPTKRPVTGADPVSIHGLIIVGSKYQCIRICYLLPPIRCSRRSPNSRLVSVRPSSSLRQIGQRRIHL